MPIFEGVERVVSRQAINKANSVYEKWILSDLSIDSTLSPQCTGLSLLERGLPCRHTIQQAWERLCPLSQADFHPQWYLQAPGIHQPVPLHLRIQDPAIVRARGRPSLSSQNSSLSSQNSSSSSQNSSSLSQNDSSQYSTRRDLTSIEEYRLLEIASVRRSQRERRARQLHDDETTQGETTDDELSQQAPARVVPYTVRRGRGRGQRRGQGRGY